MGTSSPEILKELACLQMRKRRTKKYEYPFKLREAAFSVLEELDAAAAKALRRVLSFGGDGPSLASVPW